ncbi:MAG: hypothetical protein WC365_06575 [Candidatus Babeliales bacterium]|jgi:hypothetical protein
MSEPRFKLLRGIRRNAIAEIRKALPEDAEVLSAIPQSNLPDAIAVVYMVPEKKSSKTRKPSTVSKPSSINKPSVNNKRVDVP